MSERAPRSYEEQVRSVSNTMAFIDGPKPLWYKMGATAFRAVVNVACLPSNNFKWLFPRLTGEEEVRMAILSKKIQNPVMYALMDRPSQEKLKKELDGLLSRKILYPTDLW